MIGQVARGETDEQMWRARVGLYGVGVKMLVGDTFLIGKVNRLGPVNEVRRSAGHDRAHAIDKSAVILAVDFCVIVPKGKVLGIERALGDDGLVLDEFPANAVRRLENEQPALAALVNADPPYKWTGTLLDDVAEPLLNGALDLNGRPLFVESVYTDVVSPYREGRILGRPTYISDHVSTGTTVGYMGDWSQIVWGQVGGISFDVSDQATLNLGTFASPNFVSLWQHNLVAVRVEAEYGALVNDPDAFVKLTNTTA